METTKDPKTLQYEAERAEKLEEAKRRKERDIERRKRKKTLRHVWSELETDD